MRIDANKKDVFVSIQRNCGLVHMMEWECHYDDGFGQRELEASAGNWCLAKCETFSG